jgi:hypothetical protein
MSGPGGPALEGKAGVTLTREDVREVLDVYVRAWETQDPDLIVTIFGPGGYLARAGARRPDPRPGGDPHR